MSGQGSLEYRENWKWYIWQTQKTWNIENQEGLISAIDFDKEVDKWEEINLEQSRTACSRCLHG